MSLPRLAVRIAAVAALRGRTWAGDRVRDSAVPPIDKLAQDERLPFIAIYTDDSEFAAEEGRGLMSSNGKFALVFEIGITAQMQFVVENNEVVEAPGKPPTDAQMELMLDLIERQIKTTLSEPSHAWSEMWRRLVANVVQVKSQRGANAEDGVRFAGRQLILDIKPFAEPPCGREPSGLYADFITLLRADSDQGLATTVADMVERSIVGDVVHTDWQSAMAQLALTRREADAMQVTPALEGLTGEETVSETVYTVEPLNE